MLLVVVIVVVVCFLVLFLVGFSFLFCTSKHIKQTENSDFVKQSIWGVGGGSFLLFGWFLFCGFLRLFSGGGGRGGATSARKKYIIRPLSSSKNAVSDEKLSVEKKKITSRSNPV